MVKDEVKVLQVPVYCYIEPHRLFIHFEPCPHIIWDMVPVKRKVIVTRTPRQLKKELVFNMLGKLITIVFFYTEGQRKQ